ncbi:hypothetical protein [Salinimicrobium flavum]|uniref:Uncharacterized protein n=1 Tax=Salinimicrobium flavum TaxID=1737065 RepID=A0ABW5J2N7_9FLAO
MRKYILPICLLLLSIPALAQEVVFKAEYKPGKKYIIELRTVASTETSFSGDPQMMEYMESAGVTNPVISKDETFIPTTLTTGAREEDGQFPAIMVYGDIDSKTVMNGETYTKRSPLSGVRVMGKYSNGNKFVIDSVIGNEAPADIKNMLVSTIENLQQQIEFPRHSLKVGDTFTNKIPIQVPVEGMKPIRTEITTLYKLKKIDAGTAFFDLQQTINLNSEQEEFELKAEGTGTGSLEYDIKEEFITSFNSEIPMELDLQMPQNLSVKVKMNTLTSQKVSIE